MRYNKARKCLIFWCLFIGIGAVAGSTGMFVDISGAKLGFEPLLPYFQVLPFADTLFKDFLFPGIALLIVNGLTNLTAAIFLLMKVKLGHILGGLFGVTLMLWICIQFVIFPANFMSTIYFVFGFLQAATGYACLVFYRQEKFIFEKFSYENLGNNDSDTLVIYFSRLGRVAKAAYEYADKLGADIYEVKTTERTDGSLGFWWSGRFAMHRWAMAIEKLSINLDKYKKVVICTPVWVFRMAAPIRGFLQEAAGHIKKADYIAVHFNPWLPKAVFEEMDSILKIKAEKRISISSALGNLKIRE